MPIMPFPPSNQFTLSLPRAIRLVGLAGAAIGIFTVLGSAIAFSRENDFSVFTTYLSDFGNAPGWTSTLFSSGMLVVAPVRFAFLVLLLETLARYGASSVGRYAAFAVGLVAVVGSIGTAAIPLSLSRPLHMGSAFMYFLSTVALQSILAGLEWRARLPRMLPVLSLSVVIVYLVFAILLALVGKVSYVTRETPVIWEWFAFVALMLWLIAHSVMVGAGGSSSGGPRGAA
jgi:hypothetical membrane protein